MKIPSQDQVPPGSRPQPGRPGGSCAGRLQPAAGPALSGLWKPPLAETPPSPVPATVAALTGRNVYQAAERRRSLPAPPSPGARAARAPRGAEHRRPAPPRHRWQEAAPPRCIPSCPPRGGAAAGPGSRRSEARGAAARVQGRPARPPPRRRGPAAAPCPAGPPASPTGPVPRPGAGEGAAPHLPAASVRAPHRKRTHAPPTGHVWPAPPRRARSR